MKKLFVLGFILASVLVIAGCSCVTGNTCPSDTESDSVQYCS